MSSELILIPFFGMFILTFVVWVYMFMRRIHFIETNKLSDQQLQPTTFFELMPASVSSPSDNLKNLFELPLLFYVLVLYLHNNQRVDESFIIAAWLFFVFRCFHSLVHCTFNKPKLRFALYFVSAIGLWFMLGKAIWLLV